ncbi:hypothetical protein LEN26_020224 [Aphanomyces euteiches]|nr:hypothetical protein LEN26_020224 [Aphanomyces euteiches]KAH9116822.1 hypothetical protein AeMF1_009279 [Aphanomyces euteiches]KAH9192338.1 hypothetical protein AeNC1_005676 [Aphanomyces euteiches]
MMKPAKKPLGRGPEWRYFGSPVFEEDEAMPVPSASAEGRGVGPSALSSITFLLKPPKKIPRVACIFCQIRVSARSNSLRRHLRECTKCTDEARQYCVKIEKMHTPFRNDQGNEHTNVEKTPDKKEQGETNSKAIQRRLKNRLACRANRKRKKALREHLKAQVMQMCAENSQIHQEINALLGFDNTIESKLTQDMLHELEAKNAQLHQDIQAQCWYNASSDLLKTAAAFFSWFLFGSPRQDGDNRHESFYSRETCQVVSDLDTFVDTFQDLSLESIWDTKSYLFDAMQVHPPEVVNGHQDGEIVVSIVEEASIRDLHALQSLLHPKWVEFIRQNLENRSTHHDNKSSSNAQEMHPRVRLAWTLTCWCSLHRTSQQNPDQIRDGGSHYQDGLMLGVDRIHIALMDCVCL